ncbi:MAG: histidinol-phosphatase [Paludibacter sp.]
MYWSNYHSHCTFCDGRSSMEEFVESAIAKGIKSYGFSSHAPLPFLTKWTMKEDDFDDYLLEFNRLKIKYKNQIELYFGLEVDYIENYSSIENDFFQGKTFDYLIGSIHYLDKIDDEQFFCIDGDFNDFDKGLQQIYNGDIKLAVKRFFEVTNLMIQKGGFDIVGHFDKISLNASNYKSFDGNALWYKNLVGETLQLLKEQGMILEINTKSLFKKGFTYPHQQFYPLINELQIPIMVNSDCHYPINVIDGFEPTFRALKKAGFKTMQQLNQNKWQSVPFNENGLLV